MSKPTNKTQSTKNLFNQEAIIKQIRYFLALALGLSARKIKVVHNYKTNSPDFVINKKDLTSNEQDIINESKSYMTSLISKLA
jgi:predicted MPP superfamily phosphohydrolase